MIGPRNHWEVDMSWAARKAPHPDARSPRVQVDSDPEGRSFSKASSNEKARQK